MNKDRISELENKIAEAFKAGNRARRKESVSDSADSGIDAYPEAPDLDPAVKWVDPQPLFMRLSKWMKALGWNDENNYNFFNIHLNTGDTYVQSEVNVSTDIYFSKNKGYGFSFYIELTWFPWEVSWSDNSAFTMVPGSSYRTETDSGYMFLDWEGFCRSVVDATKVFRSPEFAEFIREFGSNYILFIFKRAVSNSSDLLPVLFEQFLRERFGLDVISDRYKYKMSGKAPSGMVAKDNYDEILAKARMVMAAINLNPDDETADKFRQMRIAELNGNNVSEAFKAGNRARKKESVQDTVESPDTPLQKFLRYFSEDAFKTITECGVYNYSVKVTGPESFRINCIQTTDSEGDSLPYGEVELIIDLTDFTFDGKWYRLAGEMAWKDADGTPGQNWDNEQQDFIDKEDFGFKCRSLFALAKNAWMKIGMWIEFGSNAHAEPHEWYFDEKIREVMRNDGIEMDEPAEVGEAFRAGNRARKKEAVQDTVEGFGGDRIFKDFDDFKTVAEGLLRSTGLEMDTKIEILPDTKNWYGLTVGLNDHDKPYDVSLIFKFVNIGRGDGLQAVGDGAKKVKDLPGFNEALHNGIERFDISLHGEVSPADMLNANGIKYRLTVASDWTGHEPDPMFMPVAGWNVYNPDVPVNYAVLTYSMLKALVDNIIVPLARGYHDSTDLKDRLDTFRLSVISRVDKELKSPKKPEGSGSGTWRHDKEDLLKSVRRILKKDGLFRFRAILDTILSCNGRLEKDSRQEYINPYGLKYLNNAEDQRFFINLKNEYYSLFKDRKPFDVCI